MRRRTMLKHLAGAVLLILGLLLTACGAEESVVPTLQPTEFPRPTQTIKTVVTSVPVATSTASTPQIERQSPSPEPPTATAALRPASWYGTSVIAFFVQGSDEQAELFGLNGDGTTGVLFSNVGSQVRVSPDGTWLGFVRWSQDGLGTLEVHNPQSGKSWEIVPDSTGGIYQFSFDSESRSLVYLELGAPSEVGIPWALVVVDLEGETTARHDALMSDTEARPLPGAPVGWSNAAGAETEVIIDTFLPYTEAGYMGVWGLQLPASGGSALLDTLSARELIPGSPVYSSRIFFSVDGQRVAFLGRNPDYAPDNYFPEFYDLAVNRLGVVAVMDGTRSTIVDVSDGSALARALTWSPNGERLLFAQGHYDGEQFADLSLKSSDLGGAIVTYGPLIVPDLGGLLSLAWCDPSFVLYSNWDDGNGMQYLYSFNLNTGVSTQIGVSQRLEIVGCAP